MNRSEFFVFIRRAARPRLRSFAARLRYRAMWILQSPEGTFRLTPGAVKTIGRAPRADFILDAPLVSRLHCRITATAENLAVEDLKSTNGTFVNDRRVERGRLGDGDRLRIGRIELTVQKK